MFPSFAMKWINKNDSNERVRLLKKSAKLEYVKLFGVHRPSMRLFNSLQNEFIQKIRNNSLEREQNFHLQWLPPFTLCMISL